VNCRRLFGAVVCTIFAWPTTAAAVPGQNNPVADGATAGNEEGRLPSSSEAAAGPLQGAGIGDASFGLPGPSRWTVSADSLLLERLGTANQTLVSTYPGVPSPTTQFVVGQGTDRLNSDDLVQGFAVGPKLGLTHHGDNGYDLEFSLFEVDGWNNAQSIASGANTTPVFVAPGGFVQTTDCFASHRTGVFLC
jgi:hypothetical protein